MEVFGEVFREYFMEGFGEVFREQNFYHCVAAMLPKQMKKPPLRTAI